MLWRSLQGYWLDSTQRWVSWGLLVLLALASIGSSVVLIGETVERGHILSALAAQDSARFVRSITVFTGLLVASVVLLSLKVYIQERLGLSWRRWLTQKMLSQYLDPYRFYHLQSSPAAIEPIDNPDQRMADDLRTVCQDSLVFLTITFDSAVQLIGFVSVLWLISKSLMGILVTYAVIGTVITTLVFGKVLLGINRQRLEQEADFRYGLIQVREQAEAIAFYQGQDNEHNHASRRFLDAYQTVQQLIRWQFGLTIFQNGYQYLTFILPFIILAPQIFAGQQEIGTVIQSQAAFERIGFALGLVITQFDKLSVLGAAAKRLDGLQQGLELLQRPEDSRQQADLSLALSMQENRASNIQNLTSKNIAFQHLTLTTPTKTLVHNLSLEVTEGRSLLITGTSGVGKSSLVRAIAGLWRSGEGTITSPPREQLLFLPQRPYMPLGNLRYQLCYPRCDAQLIDELSYDRFKDILVQVNLAHLWDYLEDGNPRDSNSRDSNSRDNSSRDNSPRDDNPDTVDWSKILSLGEQQRLAIARLLLNPPTYAILDEATSALDEPNEVALYETLQHLPTTIISIGHRPSLMAYHQQVLTLYEDATWTIRATSAA
ncbi:MAG: ABC transporter ATP-binding protein/permease [Cyanothece sp. SIO2G6]|nr:ABC transporter ATP-binding protein/permease [Cyanothece sp. SIO2G6]